MKRILSILISTVLVIGRFQDVEQRIVRILKKKNRLLKRQIR